jgi:hypothetical protein
MIRRAKKTRLLPCLSTPVEFAVVEAGRVLRDSGRFDVSDGFMVGSFCSELILS